MTEQELQELFQLLETQGLRPQLCDTPVTYYDNAVHCGSPMGAGDIVEGEYQWLPRDIVHRDTIVIIRAVLMGFFRAMLLYVMNGCRWSKEIAEFAAWSTK